MVAIILFTLFFYKVYTFLKGVNFIKNEFASGADKK